MTAIIERFDRWVFTEHRASTRDLAVARIIVAAYLLLQILPQGSWVADLPDVFFNPPLGLAALWQAFPPQALMVVLNVASVVVVCGLLVGYRTEVSSVATTVMLIVLLSFVHATGKIDHSILLAITPAIMATSGWGRALSVDARRPGIDAEDTAVPRPRWQLAWLAVAIATAIATAGVVKLATGWLDPAASSSFGHAFRVTAASSRSAWLLGEYLLTVPDSWIWEAFDWGTVAIELAGLLAIWRRTWFRAWLVSLALFHVGVALQMDIWFANNLVAYAMFVPWGLMVTRSDARAWSKPPRTLLGLIAGTAVVHGVWVWTTADVTATTVWSRAIESLIVLGAPLIAVWAWVAIRHEARVRHRPAAVTGAGPDQVDRGDMAGATRTTD